MPEPRVMLDLYLHLSQAAEEQHHPQQRDKFLIMAASLADYADYPQIAEECRRKVLQHNPGHLLRDFPSMHEALRSRKVRRYARGLLRVYPFEKAEYLLHKFQMAGYSGHHGHTELAAEGTGPLIQSLQHDGNVGKQSAASAHAPAHEQETDRTVPAKQVTVPLPEDVGPESPPSSAERFLLDDPWMDTRESEWSPWLWVTLAFALGVATGGAATMYYFGILSL